MEEAVIHPDDFSFEAQRLVLVAALGKNRVLGRDNALIWHLRTDLQRYKKITLGKPMIMGRKTYHSIGRPLPGRRTIVLTRDKTFREEGVWGTHTLAEAFILAKDFAREMQSEEIIVAGGQNVYEQTLPFAHRMRLTFVDASPEGDAWFPRFNADSFKESYREHVPADAHNEYAFDFVDFERVI